MPISTVSAASEAACPLSVAGEQVSVTSAESASKAQAKKALVMTYIHAGSL